jgi:hypothetical protein
LQVRHSHHSQLRSKILQLSPLRSSRHGVAAFTARHELKAYLQRRRDVFTNPLVYPFRADHGPSIMTMSSALAE